MSKYTTEVRYICETAAGLSESTGGTNIGQVIHSSHSSVIGPYPIFDESYRETLNTKILKHYYTREIGYETVGLWKFKLNTKMNEIMPYYNQLYRSELIKFNPLLDIDYTDQKVRNLETGEENSTSNTSKGMDERNSISSNESSNLSKEHNEASGLTSTESTNSSKENNESAGINSSSSSNSSKTLNESNGLTSNDSSSTSNGKTENTGINAASSSKDTDSSTDSSSKNNALTTGSSQNDITKDQMDLYSDTPQGGVTGLDISSNGYLTNARKISGTENKNDSTSALSSGASEGNTATTGSENTESSSSSINAGKSETSGETKSFGSTINSASSEASQAVEQNQTELNSGKSETSGENKSSGSSINLEKNEASTESKTNESALSAGKSESSSEGSSTSSLNTTESYIQRIVGKRNNISNSKLLQEFRDTFLNIDMLVIKDLSDLFMNIW